MGGIASAFVVSPVSLTLAGSSINQTSVAASVTVGFASKPVAQLWFTNTSNTEVNVVRVPITINGQGVTVAGTAAYMTTVPAGGFRAYDYKSNGIVLEPSVFKAYAAGTPASGTFVVEVAYNK